MTIHELNPIFSFGMDEGKKKKGKEITKFQLKKKVEQVHALLVSPVGQLVVQKHIRELTVIDDNRIIASACKDAQCPRRNEPDFEIVEEAINYDLLTKDDFEWSKTQKK